MLPRRKGPISHNQTVAVLLMAINLSHASGQGISFLRGKDLPVTDPPVFAPSRDSDPTLLRNYFSFASGDFNGDGKMDFVAGVSQSAYSSWSCTISIVLYLGNGDGTFKRIDVPSASMTTSLANGQGHVMVADFNGDKKLDLLVTLYDQTRIFLGNGDGSFRQGIAAKPEFPPEKPLVAADFTGDGKVDLLVSSLTDEGCFASFRVFPGHGDGTFGSPLPCSDMAGDGDWSTRDIAVADLNGDGKLDVVWGNVRSNPNILAWLGNGDGTFKKRITIEAGTGQGAKPLAIADVNHDGIPDIVVAAHYFEVTVLLGNGDGTFRKKLRTSDVSLITSFYSLLYNTGDSGGGPRDWFYNNLFLRDFDGDGHLDILLDGVLFRGIGDGFFQQAQYLGTGSAFGPGRPAPAILCEDLNGDGKADLMYLGRTQNPAQAIYTGSLVVLLNTSNKPIPTNLLAYSSANGGAVLAPGMLASVFGKNLAATTATASGNSLQISLAGISLRVRDSTDAVKLAPLLFVSPSQINFLVPPGTSIGPATFNLDDGATPFLEGANATIVSSEAPGFFTVSQTGQGVPAATAVRILPGGSQASVAVFACGASGQCSATPIDLSQGAVYLSLYGTGFAYSSSRVQCQVGGMPAVVPFHGAHPVYAGLDQLNLLLPAKLPSGLIPISCTFDEGATTGTAVLIQ